MDSPRADAIHDPIQQLQFLAAEMSGVTIEDAYAIDGVNLGKKLPDYVITQLCDTFYHKIYDDERPENDWYAALNCITLGTNVVTVTLTLFVVCLVLM